MAAPCLYKSLVTIVLKAKTLVSEEKTYYIKCSELKVSDKKEPVNTVLIALTLVNYYFKKSTLVTVDPKNKLKGKKYTGQRHSDLLSRTKQNKKKILLPWRL